MTREKMFGQTLEDMGGEELWRELEAGLEKLDSWLNANGPGKTILFMGDTITFSDIQIASFLKWANIVCGEDSEDWKRLANLHNGKSWGYLARCRCLMYTSCVQVWHRWSLKFGIVILEKLGKNVYDNNQTGYIISAARESRSVSKSG
ncbi:hypothetical protein PHLCEN_2v11859 [Hermanssonia centrifuga]|uniref:Glutathione S-transferase UstS-like C-terminal domain-containing protein n=1 Tax=Hermanssonia centrifuga TaxID=98765 RepID=A0A2R6NIR0_9APHY|nr:hypothetical protein PHLCEN_2v11859 [Hermanssonia centrifuga]